MAFSEAVKSLNCLVAISEPPFSVLTLSNLLSLYDISSLQASSADYKHFKVLAVFLKIERKED